MKASTVRKGLCFTAAGAVGWGISGVCSQYLFAEYQIEASWLTAVRMILSGLVLLTLSFSREKLRIFHVLRDRRDCKWLISFALAGLLLCQYTYMGAIQYSNSATASVLQSLNVILMAVIMAVRTRTGMRRTQLLATGLAILGTYLIATNGRPAEMMLSVPGFLFGIVSAAGVVSYTLLSRPIIQKWGNITITGWGMLIGGTAFGALSRIWIFPAGLDLRAFLVITVIVLIGTAGGFSLFLQGVRYIGPARATRIGCLEPAAATVFSALFLHTQFTAVELLGFACILLTVFLSADQESLEA